MMTQSSERIKTLIIAKPGLLCNSLVAFLRADAQIEIIGVLSDPAIAVTDLATLLPQVLVLDADLPANSLEFIHQLSILPGKPVILALSNTVSQRNEIRQAGADQVFLKGFLDDLPSYINLIAFR